MELKLLAKETEVELSITQLKSDAYDTLMEAKRNAENMKSELDAERRSMISHSRGPVSSVLVASSASSSSSSSSSKKRKVQPDFSLDSQSATQGFDF